MIYVLTCLKQAYRGVVDNLCLHNKKETIQVSTIQEPNASVEEERLDTGICKRLQTIPIRK